MSINPRLQPTTSAMMKSYLPELSNLPNVMRKGRSVRDGYQRGWGLQHGGVQEAILADSLYQEACALARGRTVITDLNRMNLFLILKLFLPSIERGHIIEFGSYKGGNAIFMAHVASKITPGVKVYALDSFEGMPETDHEIDLHGKGDVVDVDLQELRDYVKYKGITNLEVIKGYFDHTAVPVLQEARQIALAHIDCDIASSVQ